MNRVKGGLCRELIRIINHGMVFALNLRMSRRIGLSKLKRISKSSKVLMTERANINNKSIQS